MPDGFSPLLSSSVRVREKERKGGQTYVLALVMHRRASFSDIYEDVADFLIYIEMTNKKGTGSMGGRAYDNKR